MPTVSRRAFLGGQSVAEPQRCLDGAGPASRVVVLEACLALRGVVCGSCRDACDIGAIRMRPRLRAAPAPVVDGARCTGCGACVAICPADAIRLIQINAPERGDAA